eukprot:scaffold63258_cov59-Phaeocystis_antarctica.AAC.3
MYQCDSHRASPDATEGSRHPAHRLRWRSAGVQLSVQPAPAAEERLGELRREAEEHGEEGAVRVEEHAVDETHLEHDARRAAAGGREEGECGRHRGHHRQDHVQQQQRDARTPAAQLHAEVLLLAVRHRAPATAAAATAAAAAAAARCQPRGIDPVAISLASSFASSFTSSSPYLSTASIAAASSFSSSAAATRRHITEDKRRVPNVLNIVLVLR